MNDSTINRRHLLKAGALLAGSPLLHRVRAEAGHAPDLSIAAQLRRGQRMVEIAARQGGSHYEEALGLIAMTDKPGPYQQHKHRDKYRSGGRVAWYSPEYAMALLETNRDLPRANRIIASICDYLERDPGEPSYGNARGYSTWDRVQDTNAIVFLIYKLAPLWMKHRDKLEPPVRAKLEEFLEIGAVGLIRRAPIWWYSNIFIMTMAGTLMLAKVLDRPDLARLAARQWNQWLKDTAECSLVEANSATYYAHQIIPTIAIARYAVDDKMRQQARRAADFLLILMTGNYHPPTGALGGTTTRAYMVNCLSAAGAHSHMLHYYFDVTLPEVDKPNLESLSMLGAPIMNEYPHEPCDEARRLVHERRYPDTFITRYGSYFGKDYNPSVITCTTHHTEDMTIASQRGVWGHYHQEIPLYIVHRQEGPRPTIFLRGGPTNCLIDPHFAQDRNRILGILYWDQPTFRMMKTWWPYGPAFQAQHTLYLGPASEFDRVLVDGKPVSSDTDLDPASALTAECEDRQIAIRSIPSPDGLRQAAARVTIDDVDELKLVITYVDVDSADAFLATSPSAFGISMTITRDPSVSPDVSAKSSLTAEDSWSLHVDDALSVSAPVTPEARQAYCEATRPPIKGAVVEHPYVPFRTADEVKRWFGV